jgi:hypothetical protein
MVKVAISTVETIVGQLREKISTKQDQPSPAASLSAIGQASAALGNLRADCNIYNTQFVSHRPVSPTPFVILGRNSRPTLFLSRLSFKVAYSGTLASHLTDLFDALGVSRVLRLQPSGRYNRNASDRRSRARILPTQTHILPDTWRANTHHGTHGGPSIMSIRHLDV